MQYYQQFTPKIELIYFAFCPIKYIIMLDLLIEVQKRKKKIYTF